MSIGLSEFRTSNHATISIVIFFVVVVVGILINRETISYQLGQTLGGIIFYALPISLGYYYGCAPKEQEVSNS